MKNNNEEEANKIRKKVADIINADSSNIYNYDWLSLTNNFRLSEMANVLKYIKEDTVYEEVRTCILNAYKDAKKHYEPNTSMTIKEFEYELDKAWKIRKLYKDLYPDVEDEDCEKATSNRSENEEEALKLRIRELEHTNKGLEAAMAKANEKNEEIEALKKRISELEEELSKRNDWGDGDIKDLDNNQRLAIDERIIFFSSALGVSMSPEYINQKKMATLISVLSGDKPESIRTRLVFLNREEKKVYEDKDSCYSQSTKEAANNVYNYVAAVAKSETTTTKAMKDIMKNINLIYDLNKENKDK